MLDMVPRSVLHGLPRICRSLFACFGRPSPGHYHVRLCYEVVPLREIALFAAWPSHPRAPQGWLLGRWPAGELCKCGIDGAYVPTSERQIFFAYTARRLLPLSHQEAATHRQMFLTASGMFLAWWSPESLLLRRTRR